MSDGLRALASSLGAQQEERTRALAEASARHARAHEARLAAEGDEARATDALDRARERGGTAATRALSDAHRERLRLALRAARARSEAARRAEAEAARAVDEARDRLSSGRGEQQAVEATIGRRSREAALVRARREDDEPP